MKKNLYRLCLTILGFLVLGQSFAQNQKPFNIAGVKLLPAANGNARQNTSGLRTLACSTDSIVLTRQSQIDSFPITNPGCTILRELRIDGAGASPAITRLDSLKDIVQVTNNLTISNTAVTSLSALSSLTQLNGLFWVNDNKQLLSTGLAGLTNIGLIIFYSNDSLSSIAGLTNNLVHNDLGTLIMSSTALTSLTGLEGVHSVPNMYVSGNPYLTTLNGLQNITGSGGGVQLYYNPLLTDITALNGITHLHHGTLDVSYNFALSSLTGLHNITQIDGGLWLKGNSSLTSLSSLNPSLIITNSFIFYDQNGQPYTDSIRIEDNYQLSACSFGPLCNFLDTSNAAVIQNNALGCSSLADVLASCGTCTGGALKTWNGSNGGDWDDPSNWSPMGLPQICDSVVIPSGLNDYPYTNYSISIGALRMEQGASLNMGSNNLTIRGRAYFDDADLYSGGTLTVVRPANLFIQNSYLDFNEIFINNYRDSLTFISNEVEGNIHFSDDVNRDEVSSISSNNFYRDFSIANNSTASNAETRLSENGNDYVHGTTTLISNSLAPLRVGAGESFRFMGNVVVDSDIPGQPQIENIEFNGSAEIHLTQTGTQPITIQQGTTFRFGPELIIPDQHVYISGQFRFFAGRVRTFNDRMFIFLDGSYTGAWSGDSYVWGPIKKTGSNGFTFAAGDSIYRSVVHMSAPQNSTDTVRLQYHYKNPTTSGYNTSLRVASLDSVSSREYWDIQEIEGPSLQRSSSTLANNLQFTFYYDSARSGSVQSLQHLRIARWNGSLWEDKGLGTVTGNLAEADVTHSGLLSELGIFTFGFDSYKPIITIGAVDTLACGFKNLKVPITVDSPMLAGNIFYVQLSDSSGSFANPLHIGSLQSITSDTINAVVPSHLPNGANYRLRVIGTLPSDTSVNTKTIRVLQPPTFPNLAGPVNICVGQTYTYYAVQQQTGMSFTWSLLNGSASLMPSGDTVRLTPTAAGNIGLRLTTTNACAFTHANLGIFAAPPPPTQTPTINNIGRWLYASALPAGAAGYHWYRNDTLIVGANFSSYHALLAGNYRVAFYVSCGDGPLSNAISFAQAALPQTITFPTVADKAFGDAAFLLGATTSSGLPVQYILVSGPGSIANGVYTITATGAVTIRAIQPGDNVYDTASPIVRTFNVVKGSQTISFPVVNDQTLGTPFVSMNASSSSGLTISYSIVSGPATNSGSIVYPNGVGSITVRASQAGNTNYLAAAPVERTFCVGVNSLSAISGPQYICPSQTASYSVANVPGLTYNWRLSNGTAFPSTSNSVSFSIGTSGTYTLLVSATGPCGTPTADVSYTINVINAVTPGAASNMLPANGAVGQALPLQLSWLPGSNALTYDLFVWDAEAAQPSTPFAANLTGVSYTIAANGLTYNKTYKWKLVSKNACLQTAGPVQEFRLRPLPDLMVTNVQAPSSAFSGQTVSFSWTVKNNGPGNTATAQSWTDAVFLSFDSVPRFTIPPNTNPAAWSQLDFPVRPLLVGTKQNVTALDSGQQYTNSIDFTLPLNYSQPLYVYVITNYPASANSPLQMTYANDTARAPGVVNVTLSPTPDLRVDTVLTPASVFSGSTINLTYNVKNYGVLTPAGTGWSDQFYISQSPLFNINTAIPLKAPKPNGSYYPNAQNAFGLSSGQLKPDSAYTRNVQVVIPNYIFGSYFIYVRTNATGSLYEGALANNNVGAAQLQVFLTPTPQLTVSTVTTPLTTASITQPIGVNWNIFNAGFNNNIEKAKGHYMRPGSNCLIPPPACPQGGAGTCIQPPPTPGRIWIDSLGFGGSYWIDRVYISTDPSGLNSNAILIGDLPRGTQNSGLYVSDDLLPASQCLAIGNTPQSVNTSNVILPGSNHPAAYNFTMPSNLMEGSYYVYVLTNATKSVYEYPGTPQVRRSDLPIVVRRPDLIVSSITSPTTTVGGQPVTIEYKVANEGQGSVFNAGRRDRIYVSTSPVFDGNAVLLSTQNSTQTIPAGSSVTVSYTHTFVAGTSGTRYFFVQTNYDSLFRETAYTNNISAASTTTFSTAVPTDLVVTNFSVADTVFTVFNSYFKYSVVNNGSGTTATPWMDSLFVSCSPTFNPATSFYIARRQHNRTLSNGQSYTDSFNIAIPLSFNINPCFSATTYATAYFFVKTNSDNGAYEGSNNNNNIAAAGARVLVNPLVDHVVTNVSGAANGLVARPYNVTWTVRNEGFNPGYPAYAVWYEAIYISTDSVFNSNAKLIDSYWENQLLNGGQTFTRSKSIIVPNIPTGDYYVFAFSNYNSSIVAERVRTNNTNLIRNSDGSARKIHFTQTQLPDLTDTIVSTPSSVAVGQPLQIAHTMKNIGAGDTYPLTWNTEAWLSTDFIAGNGGDVRLVSKATTGSLSSGQSRNDTMMAIMNINTLAGNYILITKTDANNAMVETVDSNNFAYHFITVYRPAPTDLMVEAVMKPDTVLLGYTIDTARWIITNKSPNNAEGLSTDGIYLSKSAVLDSSATLIGVLNKQISIPALDKDTVTLRPLVNNVVEGTYHVLVKTDLLNNIVESDKSNNTGTAAGSLYVKVKELPMNVVETNTLHTVNRYYKLIIPDSLRGATILVTLKTADSLSVRNEMFIGLGYVPTPAQATYRFETANAGNQQIVMTSVVDSVYYITIRTVSPNSPVQNITLKAAKLPFAILNVQSAQGGNIGNVTVKISGSLFTNNMTAKLKRGATTINASAVYFTNSTQVFATFNLQGKPLGLYDVMLTKQDTTEAMLVNSFSIVPANNGGLITGGGVNTGQSGSGTEPGCDPGAASGLNSQLVVELVVPEKVFAGLPFVIQVNYTNPTNFDVPAQARIIYNDKEVPIALTQSALAQGSPSLYLELTETGGPPGIIRAGASGTVTLYSKAPVTMPGHTFVKFNLK